MQILTYFLPFPRWNAVRVCHFNPLTATESCCSGIDNQLCSGKPELFGIGNQLCSGKPRYLTWYEGKVRIWVNSSWISRHWNRYMAENSELPMYSHGWHFNHCIWFWKKKVKYLEIVPLQLKYNELQLLMTGSYILPMLFRSDVRVQPIIYGISNKRNTLVLKQNTQCFYCKILHNTCQRFFRK